MAARMRKTHQEKYAFYVYEILNAEYEVIYVGKGSNSRMAASLRHRGGTEAREVARFYDEDDAYDFEIERIAFINPILNKHAGGNGGRVGGIKGIKVDAQTRLMDKIGTKAYAARMLIGYYQAFKYITSKIDGEKIFKYPPDVVKALSLLDIGKLYEVGYGSRT